jgi:hypothetical protein
MVGVRGQRDVDFEPRQLIFYSLRTDSTDGLCHNIGEGRKEEIIKTSVKGEIEV